MSNSKVKVALLSVGSNSVLTVLKFGAGFLSGSVSVISEAIHSSMDLIASLIAFIAVRVSDKPADAKHPYGHGKIENISGVIEGLLIFVAAALIVAEAVQKIITPHPLSEPTWGIIVMAFAAVVNTFVSIILFRTAKREHSIALEADALHLKTDVVTSAGVALGLGLIMITGLQILDPIVALVVASLIIKEAWHLVSRAFKPLLDAGLTEADNERLIKVLDSFTTEVLDYHDVRARNSGHTVFVEFHILLPGWMSLQSAHELTDRIEAAIESEFGSTHVTVHMEPGK